MSRSVVLLSGGLDSTVNFKRALDATEVAQALTLDYGQRAAPAETRAAAAMCGRFGVVHRVIELAWLAEAGQSALTQTRSELPRPKPDLLDDSFGAAADSARRVWVPNRNGLFLNIAAAIAEGAEAEHVYVGFNAEEAATFPDNSAGFLAAANRAFEFSTRGLVTARCDTLRMAKDQIVKLGIEISAPLDIVWPCYDAGPRLCGTCESCLRFLRAVDRAGARGWFADHCAHFPSNDASP